jgi:hypothetical protein
MSTMPADRGLSPELLQQLTLAILGHPAEEGLRRHELVDHLRTAHDAGSSCREADPAGLNHQHWQAHGSDLASFLAAHPVQG